MQNPDRDYEVIAARKRVVAAKERLAERPSPDAALEVQRITRDWKSVATLSLVKR
jgi:hypothetical protein